MMLPMQCRRARFSPSMKPLTPSPSHEPLVGKTPARSIDDEAHQAAGDDAGDGEGEHPAHVDPANHAPVDGPPGARAETDADGGTSDTLGGGDGELCLGQTLASLHYRRSVEGRVRRGRTQTRSDDDGDGTAQLHGETTRWGVESDPVTQVLHDVVTISPQTNDESDTTEGPTNMLASDAFHRRGLEGHTRSRWERRTCRQRGARRCSRSRRW